MHESGALRLSRQAEPNAVRRPSLAGDGLPERMRSTVVAFLGLTAAAGLALVAIFAQLGFPVLSPAPLPSSPSGAQLGCQGGAAEARLRGCDCAGAGCDRFAWCLCRPDRLRGCGSRRAWLQRRRRLGGPRLGLPGRKRPRRLRADSRTGSESGSGTRSRTDRRTGAGRSPRLLPRHRRAAFQGEAGHLEAEQPGTEARRLQAAEVGSRSRARASPRSRRSRSRRRRNRSPPSQKRLRRPKPKYVPTPPPAPVDKGNGNEKGRDKKDK